MITKNKEFNFSELEARAMEQLRAGKSLLGREGALTPLIKHFTEAALRAELDVHLADDDDEGNDNRKNGKATKKMRGAYGSFELDTPRDRASTFEPQLVKKRQTLITKELEDKVISLYGLGSSYSGIKSHIEEMYSVEISEATISAVTDKLLPEVNAWRTRPLESVYPIVWMDAMFLHLLSIILIFSRENGEKNILTCLDLGAKIGSIYRAIFYLANPFERSFTQRRLSRAIIGKYAK